MTTQSKTVPAVAKFAHLALDTKTVNKNITNIAKTGKALQALIHNTAVAVVIQSLPHDQGGHLDCAKALDLYKAAPDFARKEALRTWFQRYSNIRITSSKDDDGAVTLGVSLVKPDNKDYKSEVDVLKASDNPFWNIVAVEGVVRDIDDMAFSKALDGFLARMNKAKEEGRLHLSPKMQARLEHLHKMQEPVKHVAEQSAAAALKAQASSERKAA